MIRLASGRLFFVADLFGRKTSGPKGELAFVALSDDDGRTWKTRPIPGIKTVGYVTATQAPNGVIHIVTSKSEPERHIELNEQWVFEGGPETAAYGGMEGRHLQRRAQDRRRKLVERPRAQAVGARLGGRWHVDVAPLRRRRTRHRGIALEG